jgi:hypothetical protein
MFCIKYKEGRLSGSVIFRRNCLLKRVTEGKREGRVEVTGRRVKRRKQLPDDLQEKRILEIQRGSTQIALCGGLALERTTDLS